MLSIGTTEVSTQLLVEVAKLSPADHVVILSAADPTLTLHAARQTSAVGVYDESYGAFQRLDRRLSKSGITNVTLYPDVYPPKEAGYDAALMVVPKGRDFARAQMWSALKALRPGARLYIAGPTPTGTKTILDDARTMYGHGVTLVSKQRHRVGVSIRPKQVPAYPWGDDPTVSQQRQITARGRTFPVTTIPGIFSWDHLDDGTAFLLDHLEVAPGQTVLDVGCGNGIIGVVLAPDVRSVTMTDDNLLAIRCATDSAAANGIENVTIFSSDVYSDISPDSRFDLIVCNPPFHKDFDVNTNVAHRIMRDAKPLLSTGGRLVIVANAFLKYEDVMAQHLKTRILARDTRFIVIEGSKS